MFTHLCLMVLWIVINSFMLLTSVVLSDEHGVS